MISRTELRLFLLIGLAAVGAGGLVWGNATGRLQIFGDVVTTSPSDQPIVVSPRSVRPATTVASEDFSSSTLADPAKTTARWDIDAANVTLEPGTTTGLAQSRTIATETGASVTATVAIEADRPLGSAIDLYLSADGGRTWEPVFPGRVATFEAPKGDWRWRALLARGTASVSPSIETLAFTLTPSD